VVKRRGTISVIFVGAAPPATAGGTDKIRVFRGQKSHANPHFYSNLTRLMRF
jgi:hypothetical protein